jgi:hypothetical protein
MIPKNGSSRWASAALHILCISYVRYGFWPQENIAILIAGHSAKKPSIVSEVARLGSQNLPGGVSLGLLDLAKCMLRNNLEADSCLVTDLLPFPLSSAEVLHTNDSPREWLKTADAQFGGDTLRGETKERWRELCERVVVEQNPDRFVATIQELLQALEDREERRRNVTVLRVPLDEKSVN